MKIDPLLYANNTFKLYPSLTQLPPPPAFVPYDPVYLRKLSEEFESAMREYDLLMTKQLDEACKAFRTGTEVSSMDNITRHQKICTELNDLYEKKNHDYGDSFHKTFVEEGFAMSRIRLTDKLERFKKLSRDTTAKVTEESLRDTLIDLANYAIMTIMEIDSFGDK